MRKNMPLVIIFIVVFIDLLGFGILIPILPTFAVKELGISESAIGIVLATFSLMQFLLTPFFGSLSDKHGRRNIILVTLLLNASGYIIFAYTTNFFMLLLSRVVAGIGASNLAVAQAYIADTTSRQKRSRGMGLIGVAFGLGFVFGPIIGGALSKSGYMVTGFASAGFSVLAFTLSFFFLPETVQKSDEPVGRRKVIDIDAFKSVFKMTGPAAVILVFFVITFAWSNIFGTFALLGYEIYHMTDFQIGVMFGIMGGVGAVVQWNAGFLSKRFTDIQLLSIGLTSITVGLLTVSYTGTMLGVAISTVFMAIGTGTLAPELLSLVSRVAPDDRQGLVLGVNQSIGSLGRMLGPFWGGLSYEYFGYQYPFLTGGFFTFLALLFCLFFLGKYVNLNKYPGKEY